MEYRRPFDDRKDEESLPILDLQSFQEVSASEPSDTVQLISREPYVRSSIPALITAKLQDDQLIFPVTPHRSSHADHYTYISLKLDKSTSRMTTPHTDVTVNTMTPHTQEQDSHQRYESRVETGMNVHLVKGARRWTMYITDPMQKSYGTIADVMGNDNWLNGKSVGEGQIPYTADDGSMFFRDDDGEWYGLVPETLGEMDIEEGRSCLHICR
jgi:hypothetical protein